jgi:hypothetical protein
MPSRGYEIHGVRIFECAAEGTQPRSDRNAVELIGAAAEHRISLIAIPAERLGDEFFSLSTRIAGEILQKFATYGLRGAVVGDISRYLAERSSLRGSVYESNQGELKQFCGE